MDLRETKIRGIIKKSKLRRRSENESGICMDYKAENVVQNVGAMAEVTSVFYNSIVRQVPKDVALVLTQHFMDITIARPVNINLSASAAANAAAKAAQAQKQAMEAQRRIMEEKRRQMAQQEPQNRSDAPQEPTAPSDPAPDAPENRPED